MRIAHIWPKHDSNLGDHFVQKGILKLLRSRLGSFDYVDFSNKRDASSPGEPVGLTRESVPLINRSDLLVIGGSNLYEVSGGRWGVVVEPEALAELRVPVLLIGIGSGWSFAFPEFPWLPDRPRQEVAFLHRLARGSSVRDDLTARVLTRQGIGPCTVTGCPAGFVAERPLQTVRNGTVGVAFLPSRMYAGASWSPRRRRSPTYRRRRALTELFLGVVRRLEARGHTVRVLVLDGDDLPLARRLLGASFFYDPDPEALLEQIAACDVIVGFRLHAGIAGLSYGIPPIPILSDGRNVGFAETFGLLELSVPIDPGSVAMVMERVELALGRERPLWEPVVGLRDRYSGVMRDFLSRSLA
jgi:hypothetical protein